jgi:hypothetical protein
MWQLRLQFRNLVSGMLARRRSERRISPGSAADWLPPVLGPEDWSIGLMADRSAAWYLDRG